MTGGTTGAVIETHGLVKHFDGTVAVDGIDLAVPAGGVYGFLGPNGAGKTTTIRVLTGLLWPTRGGARVLGEPVRPGAPVLRDVGCMIERPAIYPYLTPIDNLRVFATARGLPRAGLDPILREALDRVGLGAVTRRKAGGFSTGMLQRLAFATALIGRPSLLILDEPTNGLDPNGVVDVRELIGSLAAEGTTIFLSSHVLPEVEQLCSRIAILRDGKVVAEGPTADLLATGERLYIRFDGVADGGRAIDVLRKTAWIVSPAGDAGVLVEAPASEASGLNRLLVGEGLFAAELAVRRTSLEAVFRELTLDRDDPASES
ncbi:MAG TPA: ABC transporter ATP-binding protein [Candidatus Limnocylindrales bacterium]|nr:ABC transporter ATP-binding protein [Candidatus Limnocylindrales bacterium]